MGFFLLMSIAALAMIGLVGWSERNAIAPADERKSMQVVHPVLVGDPYRHDADHFCAPFIPNEALGLRLRWLWGFRFVRRMLGGHWERWEPPFIFPPGIWVRVPEPTTDANIEIHRNRTNIYSSIRITERERWS